MMKIMALVKLPGSLAARKERRTEEEDLIISGSKGRAVEESILYGLNVCDPQSSNLKSPR